MQVEEGIYGVRCQVCMELVEDQSQTGELCDKHIDNPEL